MSLNVGGVIFNKVRETTSAATENIAQVNEAITYINEAAGRKEAYKVAKTLIPVATAIEEAGFARS